MTQLNDFNDTAELPELHISRLLRCVIRGVHLRRFKIKTD